MELVISLLLQYGPDILIFLGGMITMKWWFGTILQGIGKSYKVLEKAEADQVISNDEKIEFADAAIPVFNELKLRASGLTFFKKRI